MTRLHNWFWLSSLEFRISFLKYISPNFQLFETTNSTMEVVCCSSIMRALLGVIFICSVVSQAAAFVSQPRVELIPQVRVESAYSGEGSLIRLHCGGQSQGGVEPYKTRWFKVIDGEEKEFYRFERIGEPQKTYPIDVPDTNVDEDESDGNEVALFNVVESTSGLYKCILELSPETSADHLGIMSRYRLNVEAPGNSRMSSVQVEIGPSSSLTLSCDLTVQFNRTYSYEWYKDDTKIYSYTPWNDEPEHSYQVPHVNVNLQESTGSHITIEALDTESLGLYKCVATTNMPHNAPHVLRITIVQNDSDESSE